MIVLMTMKAGNSFCVQLFQEPGGTPRDDDEDNDDDDNDGDHDDEDEDDG